MKKDSLIYFAIKFSIAAAVLLVIFNFTFPYYRLALDYTVGLFFKATNLHPSDKIFLTFMPYVSLSALILSTPKRTVKEKLKFLVSIFALFYFIDIFFAIVQVLVQGTAIKYYHILVVQDFFTIALPIVFWFILDYKNLIDYNIIATKPTAKQ
jgi:hypothetical protein